MKRWFRGCLVVLVGGPVALYAAYKFYYPTYSWHQKLIVTVETPQGEVSGSSTVQVEWRDSINLLPDPPHVTSSVRGEAVVVDLEQERYLFALLGGAGRLAMKVFNEARLPQGANGLMPFARNVTATQQGTKREVRPEDYPQLVTFSNIDNPASVKQVDPDDLAASFGPGYRLKSVTLEITGDPVTDGEVEKVLGWLRLSRERFLELGQGTNPLKLPNDSQRGYKSVGRTEFRKGF